MTEQVDFCRVAALKAAEKHGLDYDAFVQAMNETLAAQPAEAMPALPAGDRPDAHTVVRELLEIVEARNSQGGGLTLNAEGQRRVDAAKALLATGCGLCKGSGVADLPDPWGGVRGTCPDCHGTGHAGPPDAATFQRRMDVWVLECFGPEIAADKVERNHRFLEEALELVQACGCTASEAHQLVDYTFSRPVGEKRQEAGGAFTTLSALCSAHGLDMMQCAEDELARIWTLVAKIRAKQAAKPKHSPLPGPSEPAPSPYPPITERMADRMRSLRDWLRNCESQTSRSDRGASEIYGAWAGAIDDLLQPVA